MRKELDLLMPGVRSLGLLTDLYELTMAAGYFVAGLWDRPATFDLFFRSLPANRSYMVAAGLEQAIRYLETFHFEDEDVAYLRGLPAFKQVPDAWFDLLRQLRFTGDVWGIPEGTVVFPGEPLLRVTAPLMQAQIVETYLLTAIGYPTSVATKASRIVGAGAGRSVVDFGTRRAHGPHAGLLAARASFIGGCSGTSNTLAAKLLNIPPVGTMAHSWVMVFQDELEAFQRFAALFPDHATLLIDTYDTVQGVRNAIAAGVRVAAVRLDSGDLAELSRQVRSILDDAGWQEVSIFATGDLNEYKIDRLVAERAPIDAFGVGTELTAVADAPSLGVVYKLVEVEGCGSETGRIKLSAGKSTYPGKKQVTRRAENGQFSGDIVELVTAETFGEPLLIPVLRRGKRVGDWPSLASLQERCRDQLARLPAGLRQLEGGSSYPVVVGPQLQAAFEKLARELGDARR